MKIAAAQISCGSGEVGGNLSKIREFVSRAKENRAELIVFPEMSDTGYSIAAIQKHASSWTEGAVPRLQQIAQENSIAIVRGVSERDGDRFYNSAVRVDWRRTFGPEFSKWHLF